MNKSKLIELVKHNNLLFALYKSSLTILLSILKLFIRVDKKKILFVSYGGRYYNDSPRCIYEGMLADGRFSSYKLIWAFRNPDSFDVSSKVRIDSIKFYIVALQCRCWITNVSVERGLPLKRKRTFYFYTTHGTLPKLSGYDSRVSSSLFDKSIEYKYDCSCAQSYIEQEYQTRMYHLKPEQILVVGYPKNDILFCHPHITRDIVCEKLHIDSKKKVLLYAPTFREEQPSEMISPVDFSVWKRILGDDWVVLFRAHPVVINKTVIDPEDSFVVDVSKFEDNCQLMLAADALISDYSGIFFEYAVLRKPMYCFAYDYDNYQKTRGLYFDVRKELPGGYLDEESLINLIKEGPTKEVMQMVELFSNKYVTEYGHATEKVLNFLAEKLER